MQMKMDFVSNTMGIWNYFKTSIPHCVLTMGRIALEVEQHQQTEKLKFIVQKNH